MRGLSVLCLSVLFLGAGCLEDEADPAEDEGPPVADEPQAELPEDFSEEVDVTFGADPFNFIPASTPVGGGGPCSSDQSSCSRFPFTLPRTATVSAALDWGMPSNDLDLYIVQDGADVSEGVGASATGTVEAHEEITGLSLDAGDYEVWVVQWLVVQETYTIAVTFE